jgi:hypothetical protein
MAGIWYIPIPETGCWIWARSVSGGGYANIRINGKQSVAHRVAYEALRGPIPEGMTLDHLCRVRCCVNPDHMDPVTMQENILRGVSVVAVNAGKTHCKNGHEFTDDNTIRVPAGRQCRICVARRERESAARRRQARRQAVP